jgi:hypothetical protein
MQEREMKAVEVLRKPTDGQSPGLGIWLPLEAILEIPLPEPSRLVLWRHLLSQLGDRDGNRSECGSGDANSDGDGDVPAALLASLCVLEPLVACQALENGGWEEAEDHWCAALAHYRQLQELKPNAAQALGPSVAEGLVQVLARLDQVLTHGQWTPPSSGQEAARLHGLACDLIEQIQGLGQPLPSWLAVVEEGLVRRGALALLEQPNRGCQQRAVALLLRLAQLQQPVPDWLPIRVEAAVIGLLTELTEKKEPGFSQAAIASLVKSCRQLTELVAEPARRTAIAEALERAHLGLELPLTASGPPEGHPAKAGPALAPEQIGVLVEEWLEDTTMEDKPVDLGLVWVPGARAMPHSPGRLDLNLAALAPLGAGDPQAFQRGIEAFFHPLQACAPERSFRLRQPLASLLESLAHLWGSGGSLSPEDCTALGWAQGIWNRCGGPGALGCALLPALIPTAMFEAGHCVVQPSAIQLAGLRSWLMDREAMESALGTIRRHHHDPNFMSQQSHQGWGDPGDALESLCQLQVEEGFYAHSSKPFASLVAWAEPSLALLAKAQVVLDPQLPGSALFAVLQGLFQEQGKLPNLVGWPGETAFYHCLAGQEVLLISPLAVEVEAQHRSGRAFDLFTDQAIAPYGLRCVQGPDSLYPRRPDQGFEASLAQCLQTIEHKASALPFTVFLTACGAYDLPLCHAIQQRYGCASIAIGPNLHARFGLEQPATQEWRLRQRRADRWQCLPASAPNRQD